MTDISKMPLPDTTQLPALIYEGLEETFGDPTAERTPKEKRQTADTRRRRERELRKIQDNIISSMSSGVLASEEEAAPDAAEREG